MTTAPTAAGEGMLATLKEFAERDTVTSAAKPDVSFDGSVAVALIESPAGTETLKTALKLAAPVPSVVT